MKINNLCFEGFCFELNFVYRYRYVELPSKGYYVNYEGIKVKINCDRMELTTFSLHIPVATELIFSYEKIFTHMPCLSRRA